jgi:diaminohydroxyphosphoribosylaminopyrimidine deaminase/5-amino-6-(5-phosphoribosylamino)uracil reductase
MRSALREAKKGLGRTSPNPCVGAVVVKNNRIVGKGYHKRAGTPHAEIHALKDAGKRAKNSTLYVTLEPCNHAGRTPPCTEAILKAGISRVVVGMADPNPEVTGGGAGKLAAAGITVTGSVLEDECREINLPFIKHATTGLPWVIMKAGMSIDGKIAASPGRPTAITGSRSLGQVHALRNRVDAILVGIDTVLADNPSLTTRLPERVAKRDPMRVVLDADLRLPPSAKVLRQKSSADTLVFCRRGVDKNRRSRLEEAGAVVKTVPCSKGMLDLKAVLGFLGESQVNSVLVEGGSKVHGSFLDGSLVDQLLLFVAPKILGERGVPLASFPGRRKSKTLSQLKIMKTRRIGDDILIDGRFVHN